MASSTDKITDVRNAARPNSAKVSSGRSAGGATLACDNLTGWPTASKVHFVTYQIDSNSNPVANTQLDCTGIVSGNNIGSLVVVDGNDTGNSVNDVVEMLPTAAWGQDLADALTSQHTRTGTHKSITNTGGITTDTLTASGNATVGGTLAVTGATTLAAITATALTGAVIKNANLSTSAGELGAAWQSWVPAWTNLTVGNGTVTASYLKVGKLVVMRGVVVFGSTTSISGSVSFSLPVASVSYAGTATGQPLGHAKLIDTGIRNYDGVTIWATTTTASIFCHAADLTVLYTAAISSTVPFTWGTSDELHFFGVYEAA